MRTMEFTAHYDQLLASTMEEFTRGRSVGRFRQDLLVALGGAVRDAERVSERDPSLPVTREEVRENFRGLFYMLGLLSVLSAMEGSQTEGRDA